jgi:hypothetical protein
MYVSIMKYDHQLNVLFSEIFHSMDTNNGSHILVEHLMYIPNYGSFNSSTGIL